MHELTKRYPLELAFDVPSEAKSHRRLSESGCDHVYTNSLRRKLERQTPGDGVHPSLGRDVGQKPDTRAQGE